MMVVFFFQAEDGIRDYKVTGVQTCALPIFLQRVREIAVDDLVVVAVGPAAVRDNGRNRDRWIARRVRRVVRGVGEITAPVELRSEERRVGKECRSRWSPYH